MIRKIWTKRKERIANWWSEINTFKIVYERSRSISELSGEYVLEARTWCFAHILPKFTYPKYRNNPNNIIFVKNIQEHELVDHFVAHNKMEFLDLVESWKAIERLRKCFLIYKQNNGTTTQKAKQQACSNQA